MDYKKQNITDLNDRFDIVFDAVGKIHKTRVKRLLKDKERFVSVLSSGHAQRGSKELDFMMELVEQEFLKPVIDKIYPLKKIVEAHRHVDTGHKIGNIVLTVN